ncbi:diacylglycerol/lipid kinase family protein [Cohaesibacter intestini]|uniref:diacylglycerol/lipid kinase family protein n=1 Tax=Cohaesibacter intestini TaxID=2211145 RepID=UPI0013006644|nr:diacylglycerol kinase family protein [Cohaesibacter intestini]
MTEPNNSVHAFLNTGSGTFRTADLDAVKDHIQQALADHYDAVTFHVGDGKALIDDMEKTARSEDFAVLLAGGGDGTVSAAAEFAWKHDKILAVIPGGTMNLFARSLAMPLDLDAAIDALGHSQMRAYDIATANGRPFVHQMSIGLHPRMIRKRDRLTYGSRFGKMAASLKAFWRTIARMPLYQLTLSIDGTPETCKLSALSISNNLFGGTTPPFAEQPDGGRLGVYMVGRMNRQKALKLGADLLLGQTHDNPDLTIRAARKVEISMTSRKKPAKCVQDGELLPLEDKVTIELHPKSLRVLSAKTD